MAALLLATTLFLVAPNGAIPATAQTQSVQISSQPVLLVEPSVETPFPIQLSDSAQVPKQAFVRIRGLPPAAVLSEGHAIKAGTWAVPLTGLSNLMVTVAAGSEGKFPVLVALVLVDGAVVRETEITLAVIPAASTSSPRPPQTPVNSASLGPPALPMPPPSTPLTSPPLKLAPERQAAPPVDPSNAPQLKNEDRDRATKYVQRGDESLAAGNITMARLFYQKAAEIGWAQGALALAGTYDPAELSRLKVVGGVDPDRAAAQKWYEKARQLGSPQAAERLLKLGVR
jgi:hypothetical protein